MSKYIDADVLMEYLQEIKQQAEVDDKTKFDALESTIDVINSTIMMKTDEIMRIVENMPAADVELVRHGKWWNEYDNYSVAKCSNCGATFEALDDDEHYSRETLWELFKRDYSHCPNCGALMDEDETDEHEEMYAIPDSEPPTYTPEERAKIIAWCEEAGIDPNMIRGMKDE